MERPTRRRFLKAATVGATGLASLLLNPLFAGIPFLNGYSTTQPAQSQPASQPVADEKRYANIKLRRSSAGDGERYTAMGMKVFFEGPNQLDGLVFTDLRNVVNIAPNPEHHIDKYSFASMTQRGSMGATFYVSADAARQIRESDFLKAELAKHISPELKQELMSDEQIQRIISGSISVLLSREAPTSEYFFFRPAFSSNRVLPPPEKIEISKSDKMRKMPQVCQVPPTPEEREHYGDFSVRSLIQPNEKDNGYLYAGLAVSFLGGESYDMVGVLDLRELQNADTKNQPLNEYDIKASAFWGAAPFRIYATQQAEQQRENSPYLDAQIEAGAFSKKLKTIIVEPDSPKARAIAKGDLTAFLTETPHVLYFHPPAIRALKE